MSSLSGRTQLNIAWSKSLNQCHGLKWQRWLISGTPPPKKSVWPETYFILNTAAAAVHITAFFLLLPLRPPKFWGRVEQTAPANIWAHENSKQIFGYFKLVFQNELLHWQINLFLVFSRARLHRQVRKISTLSVKQFKVFSCKDILYFEQLTCKYYFSG